MNDDDATDGFSGSELELYQPRPDALYDLDAAAQIAGVARRTLLIYCRAGLIRPILQPPYEIMAFTEEAILTVRRIEFLRAAYGIDLAGIKTMLELLGEVERLRAEVRFLRGG